jgi:hypothetical protein
MSRLKLLPPDRPRAVQEAMWRRGKIATLLVQLRCLIGDSHPERRRLLVELQNLGFGNEQSAQRYLKHRRREA